MNLSFHAQFYSPSRQLFECINNPIATAYTSLLTLRVALTALHIKRYVTTFSSSATLIHGPLRESLGIDPPKNVFFVVELPLNFQL